MAMASNNCIPPINILAHPGKLVQKDYTKKRCATDDHLHNATFIACNSLFLFHANNSGSSPDTGLYIDNYSRISNSCLDPTLAQLEVFQSR
jgi:hypothetical protein